MMRRKSALVLIALMTFAPLVGAPSAIGRVPAEAEIAEAERFRRAHGLPADSATLLRASSDASQYSSTEYGVPLRMEESNEIKRRMKVVDDLDRAIEFTSRLPGTAGLYLDHYDGGRPVFLFAGELPDASQLAALVPEGGFRVERVQFSLVELMEVQSTIEANRSRLRFPGRRQRRSGLLRLWGPRNPRRL